MNRQPWYVVLVALAITLWLIPTSLEGAWNSVSGIKDGSDTASELANPWDGERLLAFGGTLNFAGNVNLDGELWLQQLNGWGNPVVNIPGTLTMNSPSGQFLVLTGELNVGNAAGSSVEAGKITLAANKSIVLGQVAAHDDVLIHQIGTLLHVLGDYQQDDGLFDLIFDGAFDVDGSFTKTGMGEFTVGTPNFSIGNPAASTVEAGKINLGAGQPITLAQVTAHDNVDIRHAGTLLHLLGDYHQDSGKFLLVFEGAFEAEGTFTKSGLGSFKIESGATFTLTDPATSSIEASDVHIDTGTVTLGDFLVHDNFDVNNPGVSVQLLGDLQQTAGSFHVFSGATLHVDGIFTKTGTGAFIIDSGGSLSLVDPAASSIEAGSVHIDTGTVTLGDFLAHDNFDVNNPGVSVQLLGDLQQTAGHLQVFSSASLQIDGNFSQAGSGGVRLFNSGSLHVLGNHIQGGGGFVISDSSAFEAEGTFTKSGLGSFKIDSGATFTLTDPASSSIEASDVHIDTGTVTLGDFLVHDNFDVNNPGVSVQLLGDLQQTAGSFHIFSGATLHVDGTFTKTGTGAFIIDNGGSLSLVDPAASSIEAGSVHIDTGTVTLGDFLVHDNFDVNNPGVSVQLLGDLQQTAGHLQVFSSASLQIDGNFSQAGSGKAPG